MSRELQSDLFGEIKGSAKDSKSRSRSEDAYAPETVSLEEWRLTVHQLEQLKKRVKDYDQKLIQLNQRQTELLNAMKSRVERVASSSQRTEEYCKINVHELNSKYAIIAGKMTERKLNETKIEEVVDRYSQMMNQMELRLNQLQKIVNEQELQLHSSRNALSEALREMSRLKRM